MRTRRPKKKIISEDKTFLHNQLIKLGDMMGDGMHHEPDGKWIPAEYKKVCRALGIGPARRNNAKMINEAMIKRVDTVPCTKCEGALRQTRSGSMRARCRDCGSLFQLMRIKK